MPETLRSRVAQRLEELDRNPFEAARKGGLERGFINDILIGRKRSVKESRLPALAAGLDWTVADLIGRNPQSVRIMGKIGAGAEIMPEFEQVPPDGLFEIDSEIPLPDGMVGFEVEGESMWPRYDPGDIVVCSAAGVSPETLHPGAECAVRTRDGRRYLKRVRRTNGLFTLESHNGMPIVDVELVWASEVTTVVRARQWRALTVAKDRAKKVSAALRKTKV